MNSCLQMIAIYLEFYLSHCICTRTFKYCTRTFKSIKLIITPSHNLSENSAWQLVLKKVLVGHISILSRLKILGGNETAQRHQVSVFAN